MLIEGLLVLIVVLLIISIVLTVYVLISKKEKIEPTDIEAAISGTWVKLGLAEKINSMESHAKNISDSYRSFEQMLRVPIERASFGELSLETILSDQLPPEMYGIRERTLEGKYPDANIRSSIGIICIDSKFPLDNYKNMCEAETNQDKDGFKRQFIRDVKGHLDKIVEDYVCPEKGSAEFAFGYMPSEGVYYFLICEAFDMLREYTKGGVQVVSPLTLSHKIELIKAGVHAKKLSEDAEKVRGNLLKLSRKFDKIDDMWRVFYDTHLKNLDGKAGELDEAYKKLREEFDKISELSEE